MHVLRKFLLLILATIALPTSINAVEVNCNSAVWKNKPRCKAKRDKVNNFIKSSNNDLGGADLGGPNNQPSLPLVVPSGTVSDEIYKAFCGLPTKKCLVSFKNGLLTINEGQGIKPSQVSEFKTLRSCRMGGGCFPGQWDYDYLLTYKDVNLNDRKALIAFRPGLLGGGIKKHKRFYRDIQIWSNTAIRLANSPGTVMTGSSSNLGGGADNAFARSLMRAGSNIMQQQKMNSMQMQIQQNKFNQQQLEYNQNLKPSTLGGGGLTTPGVGYYYSD